MQEETDLSFADFDGPRRPVAAPALADELPNENAPDVTSRGRYQNVERETGLATAPPRTRDPQVGEDRTLRRRPVCRDDQNGRAML